MNRPLYTELREKIDDVLVQDRALEMVCRTLHAEVAYYDWVGFYLAEGRELVLGPFVGEPTEHTRIPFGSGICGQAAETLETFLVPDVAKEANYLSCSPKVRSEIVVPILSGRDVRGEIDIDSHTPGAFTDLDSKLLEYIARRLIDLDIL